MSKAGPFSAGEIALAVGGRLEGDPDLLLEDVAALAEAGPAHLSFLSNRRYARQLTASQAGVVLVDERVPVGGRAVIRCADPYVAFARALQQFNPQPWPAPRVDPAAHVAPDAIVAGATIEAFAWVGPGAVVGPGTWLEAGAVVGEGARVGAGCRLMAHSVVAAGCVLGDRVWLNPGAVIGGEGFGFAPTADGWVKIPQVGRAVVEDDVEVGVHTAVDRAALGETRVGRGTKMDNFVQIGHAVEVGPDSCLVAYSGVAGSTRMGRGVVLAAKAAVLGHLDIGDGVQVGVASVVHSDQPAGARVTGVPAIEHGRWLRAATAVGELPELLRRVRALEARVVELEAALAAAAPTENAAPDRERGGDP